MPARWPCAEKLSLQEDVVWLVSHWYNTTFARGTYLLCIQAPISSTLRSTVELKVDRHYCVVILGVTNSGFWYIFSRYSMQSGCWAQHDHVFRAFPGLQWCGRQIWDHMSTNLMSKLLTTAAMEDNPAEKVDECPLNSRSCLSIQLGAQNVCYMK